MAHVLGGLEIPSDVPMGSTAGVDEGRYGMGTGRARWVVSALAVVVATALAGPAAPASAATPSAPRGERLYVNPSSDAARAAAASNDAEDRAALEKVAGRPTAEWFGDWIPTTQVAERARTLTRAATAVGTTAVLVAYAIPARDCNGYSAGGAGSPAAYRAWVDQLALGLGSARALVVVEPDALAQLTCLPEAMRAERLELLRYAVTRLSKERTRTYLDAGHSRWIPAGDMASRLEAAGVGRARGFALNVSNFHETAEQLSYGRSLAASVAKPFVVDTSRNGLGRGTGGWCNPPGRALGTPPTTSPAHAQVDAYLWVKTPGRSDGDCGRGEPLAGTFWPDYAVGLAARALW